MLFVVLTIFCAPLIFCEQNLKYAAIIYRHGDRTPVRPYPKDPWKDESLWPVKFGQLTNLGKKQHYELGKWLQKRYSGFLSEKYNPAEVYIRSTDVDRTLMSAQANLAGMYPPSGKSIWNADLLWQPIPVHTVPEEDDEILAMKKNCPPYNLELAKIKFSWEYKDRLSNYNGLMGYLSVNTGLNVTDYEDIDDIYSTLFIETLYNFTLPSWTISVFPDKMREPACYSFVVPTLTPALARLKVGPLIKEIIKHMVHHISYDKNDTVPKLTIYSGHDITIGSILNALGLFDMNCPPYTATILMELTHDNTTNAHYIQILYRNSTEIVEPHVLPIPHCDVRCPIEKFIMLYENLIDVNWRYECGKGFPIFFTFMFCITSLTFAFAFMLHRSHFVGLLNELGYDEHVTYETIRRDRVNRTVIKLDDLVLN